MSTLLPSSDMIRLALVTGGHNFQVPPFLRLFRSLPGIDFYPQSLDDWAADPEVAAAYDVVVFYTMHRFLRDAELPWYQSQIFSTIEQLGQSNQGVLVLHHSLAAFPQWAFWDELVGYRDRGQIGDHRHQAISIKVLDTNHPITQGIHDWTLRDETYDMASPRPEDGNHILLTTTHPKSMSALAWTRTFGKSRVFCYQSGHDHIAFADESFRRVVHNGIEWLTGR